MAASQDKVQAILEALLEDSLPLVHKGVFTPEQLRLAMCQREKHENNMLKPTYKLSDYLNAIEFEYALERTRRHKIETENSTNPLFKKQGKTDFVIVKRIIRLWDRTMHKFKTNVDLWKQYLDFCITTKSKKQFYKALSNAIRFLPFELDLWRIGIQFEIQIGLNLWKARKLYIKALKMNPKKVDLWIEMIKFQIYFLSIMVIRQKAIQGESEGIAFIMPEGENDEKMDAQDSDENDGKQKLTTNLDFEKHHEIFTTIIEDSLEKMPENNSILLQRYILALKEGIQNSKDKKVSRVIQNALNEISSKYQGGLESENKPQKLKKAQIGSSSIEGCLGFVEEITEITSEEIQKMLIPFIVKQNALQKILMALLNKFWSITMKTLVNSKRLTFRIPNLVIERILEKYNNQALYLNFLKKNIQRLEANDFKNNPKLLNYVIRFNKVNKNSKANSDIHRSLSIHCRSQPQIIERCLHFIRHE